jgi:uncharacterized protein (TIGR03086 family)
VNQVAALLQALDAQVDVGGRLTPLDLQRESLCAGWSIRDTLSHSIGVTLKFAAFAAGRTDHPHAPKTDLVGPDHVAALQSTTAEARRAWQDADLSRQCHLPFGTFTAIEAAAVNMFDVVAHTLDVSVPTGLDVGLSDEVVEAALATARALIGPSRDLDQYGPELCSADGDPLPVRFLHFLGRSL